MRILSDLLMQSSVLTLSTQEDFPPSPRIGQFCFVGGYLYIYATVGTLTSWFLLTNKINYYVHSQGVLAFDWVIEHNLGTSDLIFVVYDNYDDMQFPASVVFDSVNQITVTFTESTRGRAIIFSASGSAATGGGTGTDALVYKGVVDCSTNPNYPSAGSGYVFKISASGKIGGNAGPVVEAGDMIICTRDGTASGTQAQVGVFWNILQSNMEGAVTGPPSSINNNFASFNGSSGVILQDSGYAASSFLTPTGNGSGLTGLTSSQVGLGNVTNVAQMPSSYLDTDGALTANSDVKVASQKATKTYVDAARTIPNVQVGPFALQEVDGHTNATNLTVAQVTNSTIHNVGQGANAVTLNMPTLVSGINFTLDVGEAQAASRWRIKVPSGQYIYLLGSDGTTVTKGNSGGYIGVSAPAIGNCLACKSFKDGASSYGLMVKVVSGTWTQE